MISENNGLIKLSNNLAECLISIWGGQIVSYRPKTEKNDVFWLANLNKFDNISAIRGGVPVCWPRFAAEKLNDNFPRHGFARISEWNLKNIMISDSKIEVKLSLIPDEKYKAQVVADLYIKITDKLECSLETTNIGNKEFCYSEALHAYFNIGSRDETVIKGLSGYSYKSSLDGKIYKQKNDLTINEEFDAAFLNHTADIQIEDRIFNRVITLNKSGSNTTVVWNPNKDLEEMSVGQYKNFICVEPANQGDCFITLQPSEKHKITMVVGVKK